MLPISPSSLALVLLGSSLAVARPHESRAGSQVSFGMPPAGAVELAPLDRDWWTELARRYAPVIYLAEDERFFPASTPFILPAFTALNSTNNVYTPQPSPLNQSNLDSIPRHGSDLHLAIAPPTDDPSRGRYNAQPDFPDEDDVDRRIYGEPPTPDGAGEWDVVALVVEKSAPGVVDLYYWTYYPFNLGKQVNGLGVVGNHISDWEAIMVRTIDGEAVSVDYLSHTLDFNEGTVRWQDVTKEDDRPVAYSASGSHGLWSTPGKHTYASALGVFKLTDSTSKGARWDTSRRLLSYRFFTPPDLSNGTGRRQRVVFSGSSSWLNWRGLWGDTGVDDCWWFRYFAACQLVDGPQGPARDSLQEPPKCVISARSDDSSSHYSFTVSSYLRPEDKTTLVGVRQVCRRNGVGKVSSSAAEDVSGSTDEDEDETSWSWHRLSAESRSEGKFELEIPQCRRRLHVVSYGIALAYGPDLAIPALVGDDGECKDCGYVSPLRNVCAYASDKADSGKVRARAVVVDDLDEFGWQE